MSETSLEISQLSENQLLTITRIRAELAAGSDVREIQELLKLPDGDFFPLLRQLYEKDVALSIAKPTEQHYADFLAQSRANLRDLQRLMSDVTDGAKKTEKDALRTRLGCIKVRQEIMEGVIEVGQRLGVIDKAVEKKQILMGVAVKDLSNAEMQRTIEAEFQLLADMKKQFGDGPLDLGDMKNVTPPADEPAPAASPPRTTVTPSFSGTGKPGFARGGGAKSVGGLAKAASVRRR